MTTFSQSPKQSASDIRTAQSLIDRAFTWASTPEGQQYWQDVSDALEQAATLADAIANGTMPPQNVNGMPPAQPVAQPVNAVPPPLHTISPNSGAAAVAPGTRRPTAALPSLDQLKVKKTATPAGSPVNVAKEDTIHVFHNGQALCGQVQGPPQNWPDGHYRVGAGEVQKATCGFCRQSAQQLGLR